MAGAFQHALPRVFIYPPTLLEREFGPMRAAVDQGFFERVVRIGLSAYSTADASAADFFFVPLPFGGTCGRSRRRAARVLRFILSAYPHFNKSLYDDEPNHLLTFPADMAMDCSPRLSAHYAKHDPLPPEIDAASPSRHWMALTLTGNTEVGFQRGKDVVLPPSDRMKSGPHRCCCGASARCHKHEPCVRKPRRRSESPWRRLPSLETINATSALASDAPRFLFSWVGQASGGGFGRHGGAGPVSRKLLTHPSHRYPANYLVHDTGSAASRRRVVEQMSAIDGGMLRSTDPSSRHYGHVALTEESSIFCGALYGRANGFEARSAAAVRTGCIPLLARPHAGSEEVLGPWLPWERFSVRLTDDMLRPPLRLPDPSQPQSAGAPPPPPPPPLVRRLSRISLSGINAMRCELACAATHMSWGGRVPPASCAAAVSGREADEAKGEAGSPAAAALPTPRDWRASAGSAEEAMEAREEAERVSRGGVGAAATLLALLGSRRAPAERRLQPRRACPCARPAEEWQLFREAGPRNVKKVAISVGEILPKSR